MTLFAGIFSRFPDQPVPESVCAELRRVISRDPSDLPRIFGNDRCFLIKVDIGAFGEGGVFEGKDCSVSVIAGEPLLSIGDETRKRSRKDDAELLHESWSRGDWNLTALSRGQFSAAHYQPQTNRLILVADKLCIRPLYYWEVEQYVIFSTALRVLERLDAVTKRMSLRGVTELTALGYPLGSRTPYADISLLKASEVVQFERSAVRRHRYWHWDEIKPSVQSEPELLRRTHESFARAVSLRSGADKSTVAYLSGGLDSRCAVAALKQLDVAVHTFNFALPETQDYMLGNEFAAQVGTIHEALPKEHGDLTPDYSTLMARAWSTSKFRADTPADRPAIVWSGEGGSVALGHVHLSSAVVAQMRSGQTDKAIELFLLKEQASVTTRLLRSDIAGELADALHAGIREELDKLNCADPARSFYLFLLLNDQRRKLSMHFENIDLHRLEFQLPFFDSEFLADVVSLPIDACLRHQFYVKWLKLFSPVVSQVPWQAYPGHEPCPLPLPKLAAYQWDNAYQGDQRAAIKSALLNQAAEMLASRDFPKQILRKQYLRLATSIYKSGLRDYGYVIESAWKYYTYSKQCNRKIERTSEGVFSELRAQRVNSKTELTSGVGDDHGNSMLPRTEES